MTLCFSQPWKNTFINTLSQGKGRKAGGEGGEGESLGNSLPIKESFSSSRGVVHLFLYDSLRRVKALFSQAVPLESNLGSPAPAGAAAPSRTAEPAPAPRAAF